MNSTNMKSKSQPYHSHHAPNSAQKAHDDRNENQVELTIGFIRPLPLNREPIETLKMWAFNGTLMMYCAYWRLMDRNPEDI